VPASEDACARITNGVRKPGNIWGRVIGLVAASLGAIGALSDVGGAHPWWALGVFAICIICIHGLVVFEPAEPV
jgi:hypothetical protein